ncbi:hypothetical protein HK105_205772 [Polyrhizophydium stewartii]|uniref:CobW C-terminal domain-containing protein n=1 Tax=Polyrhizophydium stewartii TaxID=2732419 RepID=A0ABR4N564_9FUNG
MPAGLDDDDIPELVPVAEGGPSGEDEQGDAGFGDAPSDSSKKVPVTILTGFLGSGKTTLVTDLLSDPTHGKRIAVILNEFGESAGIDRSMSVGKDGRIMEEWLELANGCLCCSVKDAGVKAIENLVKKKGRFDYVVLETTGLADPGPIASLFWLDEELQSELYLDGILTVVDAKNIREYMSTQTENGQTNEAIRQVALADRIILNKTDLVDEATVESIEQVIRSINASAPVHRTVRSKVPVDFVLNLHCFDGVDMDPFSERGEQQAVHKIGEVRHAKNVTTVVFTCTGTLERAILNKWLQALLWDRLIPGSDRTPPDFKLLRLKALVDLDGAARKHIVQGVQEMYDVHEGGLWEAEPRINKFVFIGSGLDKGMLVRSFQDSCISSQ